MTPPVLSVLKLQRWSANTCCLITSLQIALKPKKVRKKLDVNKQDKQKLCVVADEEVLGYTISERKCLKSILYEGNTAWQ